MKLRIVDLGLCPYEKAYELQVKTMEEVQSGGADTLILVEHPKVITLGRNAKEGNMLIPEETMVSMGYEVKHIERGGDATYHGPGQLVGYTIFNLKKNHPTGIRVFVEKLESVFIDYLKEIQGIDAGRDSINSGVFIGEDKITAIGLAVKRGVTMHGFAFNVNTVLSDYQVIVPCGLADRGVTTLERQKGSAQDFEEVKGAIGEKLSQVYGYDEVVWEKSPF